jgi:hypothetical protein
MSTLICTVAGISVFLNEDTRALTFTCGLQIDGDGSGGNSYNDPDFQDATSLRLDGKSLSAEVDRYFVVPPAIIRAVPGIVLGCQGHAKNLSNGKESDMVAGDIGPRRKLGEGSIALAEALGIPSSPIDGGTSERIVCVTLWPGKAAVVDGKKYALQAS